MNALDDPRIGDWVGWSEGSYDMRGCVAAIRRGKASRPGDIPAMMLDLVHVASKRTYGRNWYAAKNLSVNWRHVHVIKRPK